MPTNNKSAEPISLTEFQKRFATEEACEEHLFKVNWPNGFVCPRCQGNRFYKIEKRGLYQCTLCRHQISVTAGTVMHQTKIPLQYWFWVIFLCLHDKQKHSALSRQWILDVSYPTVWLMRHKIQAALASRDAFCQLSELVEMMDDVSLGGATHP